MQAQLSRLIMSAVLVALAATGCKRLSGASTRSVEIPQTSVRDQGNAGFCWAYSDQAFIESYMLAKKGVPIDLSEEMFAFYRTAWDLFNLTLDSDGDDIADTDACSLNQGDLLNVGFNLAKELGVIPESAWSIKFNDSTGFNADTVHNNIKRRFLNYVKGRKKGSVTLEEIVSKVMVGPGVYPSAPPASFVVDGRTYTGPSYLAEYIGFNPNEFKRYNLYNLSQTELDMRIMHIKRTLARGYTVPIGIGVFGDVPYFELAGTGKTAADLRFDGGHAILITDFVNKGGRPGAMSVGEIQNEVMRPSSELAYFVVKNSWGQTNQPSSQKPGYSAIDREYLLEQAKVFRGFAVYLPKSVDSIDPNSLVEVSTRVSNQGQTRGNCPQGYVWSVRAEACVPSR